MQKILLIGKRGQIGGELQHSLSIIGDVVAYDRNGLDLTQPAQIRKVVREVSPDVIVNAAAHTAVDRAESEPELVMAINAHAPAILAEEAQRLGALLVHYSTDYVFDGNALTPYSEGSFTNPLNCYGRSKLAAEQAIQQNCDHHLILRTSWVYGMSGSNFLRTMMRLGEEKDILDVTDDQIGIPTWSRHVAEATSHMIMHYLASDSKEQLAGIFHVTSSGSTSRYGFATAIFDCLSSKNIPGFRRPQLRKVVTSSYSLPATRPLYSVLSNLKLMSHFNIQIPDWTAGLRLCLLTI